MHFKVSDSNLLGILVYTEQYMAIPTKTKAIKNTRRGYWRKHNSLGFVSVSSHALFLISEVDAWANLVHCPYFHLMKPAVNVHMTPGGTVQSFYDVKESHDDSEL